MVLVRLLLHSMRLCRRLLNFPHIAVVYSGHLPILPGYRDRIPTGFRNNATISGISLPKDTGAFLEALGFGDRHCFSQRISVARRNREARSLIISVEP